MCLDKLPKRRLICSILGCLLLASAHGQNGASDLRGTVCDSVSRAPLPAVAITLSGHGQSLSATTDQTGAFRFAALPIGEYDLDLQKSGYAGGMQTARVTGILNAEPLNLCLMPMSEIEGVVLDEDGQPLSGVQIYTRQKGRRPATAVTSDLDGRYRIQAVLPGTYHIVWRVPYEVRQRTALRNASEEDDHGYRPLEYYPGVEDTHVATNVTIAAGVPTHRLDIHLKRSRLARFSGRLVDAHSGAALSSVSVDLLANTGTADETLEHRVIDRTGRFQFGLIPHGRYAVALSREGSDQPPYFATVDVTRGGVADAELRIPSAQTIPVMIKVPDPQTRWAGMFEVQLRSPLNNVGYSLGSFDGTSPVITGIPPGLWRIQLRPKGLRQLGERPTELYIADMRLGNQNAYAVPVTVSEGGNPPLEIVLTDQVGTIAGILPKEEWPASAKPAVLAQLADDERGTVVKISAIADDGRFTLKDLPPGEYLIAAVSEHAVTNEATPLKCGRRAARVRVEGGRASSVRLQFCADSKSPNGVGP